MVSDQATSEEMESELPSSDKIFGNQLEGITSEAGDQNRMEVDDAVENVEEDEADYPEIKRMTTMKFK